MIIFKTDNYKLACELARVYAENGYQIYTDERSAVLVYEEDKPCGGDMKLFTGSYELSIMIQAEMARIITRKEI